MRRVAAGTDLTLISSGICTEDAIRATAVLRRHGFCVDHYHATTLKPFDDETIVESAARARCGVISMENHNILGGLGTAVSELLTEHGVGTRLTRIGLQDTYSHGASQGYLVKEHGLDSISLVAQIEKLTGERFGIDEEELSSASPLPEFAAEGQLEAL